VERIGGFLGRGKSYENAAAKDRVDKPSSVTRDQPPIAKGLGDAIRVITSRKDWFDAAGVAHILREDWLLLETCFQDSFWTFFHGSESLGVHDDTYAHARRSKRDHPEPAIKAAHYPDQGAIDASRAIDIFVMGIERELLEVVVRLLKAQKISNHSLSSATIEKTAGSQSLSLTKSTHT
jgi:hypothetical protein